MARKLLLQLYQQLDLTLTLSTCVLIQNNFINISLLLQHITLKIQLYQHELTLTT